MKQKFNMTSPVEILKQKFPDKKDVKMEAISDTFNDNIYDDLIWQIPDSDFILEASIRKILKNAKIRMRIVNIPDFGPVCKYFAKISW